MPLRCCIENCNSKYKRGGSISFFPVKPSDYEYIVAINGGDCKSINAKICSLHFIEGDLIRRRGSSKVDRKPHAVPIDVTFDEEPAATSFVEIPVLIEPTFTAPVSDALYQVIPAPIPLTDEPMPLNPDQLPVSPYVHPALLTPVPGRELSAAVLSEHNYAMNNQFLLNKVALLESKVRALEKKLAKVTKLYDATRMRCHRRNMKMTTLEETKQELMKNLTSAQGRSLMEGRFGSVLDNIFSRKAFKTGREAYSDEERKFALTLQFYSSKAYTFLRTSGFPLPHPSTIRAWSSRIDGKPGFTKEAFEKVRTESLDGPLLCCLMYDEMAIKKQIDWNGDEAVGYCDLGFGDLESDDLPVAKEALVFMLTAVNRSWKIPVGYCLIDGISCQTKFSLVNQYFLELKETGAQVIGLTCDGTSTNVSVMGELGVTIVNGFVVNSDVPYPENDGKVVSCFLDAAHMIKLVRNCLADKKELSIKVGDEMLPVKWSHITRLEALQNSEGLRLGNKLKRNHVEWYQQKMKVRLAAQTLSQSVADSLRFLKGQETEGFHDVDGTVMFCEKFNDIFDLLNSHHPCGKYSKAAINLQNKESIIGRIEDGLRFLASIYLNDRPITLSRRKTPFLGFQMCLLSALNIASRNVWAEDAPLKFLLTQKFSQDHLELFFSTIRRRGGDNNNPTAMQFRHAYRRTLVSKVEPSTYSNCSINDTTMLILEVGKKTKFSPLPNKNFKIEEHSYVLTDYRPLTEFVDNVIEYISGWILRGLKKSLLCSQCLEILNVGPNEGDINLINIKNKGGLVAPSEEIASICKIAEKVLRRNCNIKELKNCPNLMRDLIMEAFKVIAEKGIWRENDHLFLFAPNEEPHYTPLIREILKVFFDLRLRHIARLQTQSIRGLAVRQKLTKAITLFNNQ